MKKFALFCSFMLFFLLGIEEGYAEKEMSDLRLGMPKEEIKGIVLECEQDLCGEILFANESWQGRYILEEDILKGITISAPIDEQKISAIFQTLAESSYSLLYTESDNDSYNVFANKSLGKSPEKIEEEYQKWLLTFNEESSHACYLYAEESFYEYVLDKPEEMVDFTKEYNKESLLLRPMDPIVENGKLILVNVGLQEIRVFFSTVDFIYQRLSSIKGNTIALQE